MQSPVALEAHLRQALEERRERQLYRSRYTIDSPQGAVVSVEGRQYINFCSNDYLGLANHPEVIATAQRALSKYGSGSGASHLVCGHSSEHQQLERELAAATGRSRALLFSTGYMANLGTISALLKRGDTVFQDRLNHASLLDGGLLSGARLQRFRHSQLEDLDARLQGCKSPRKLIVVDAVYSMDGDFAPLPDLAELAALRDAWLMIDDAHGFGCVGSNGGGSLEHFGLDESQVPILMGTLGKALGSFGAFVAGSEVLIEYLIQFARPYIYTTAMPPAQAAATRAALRVMRIETWRRQHLAELINYFRTSIQALGLRASDSETAIQPLILGSADTALRAARMLRDRGLWIAAIRPPTVPSGSSRLRITLSAAHTHEQVDELVEGLRQVLL